MLVEGARHCGELRMWTQFEHGSWSANVMWTPPHGEHRLDIFAAETVRPLGGA